MDLPTLIDQFGYPTVLLGSALEGETVLLLAGYAAHRGYLDLAAVLACAWLGALLGDQFFFWLGRRHGPALLRSRETLAARVARSLELIERHPVQIILSMRFLWGLRMALPIAVGMSGIPWRRFLWLNAVSAIPWATLVGGAGYLFGALLTQHIAELHRVEHWIMALVLLLALALHGLAWLRRRARGRR
jgi:membrane protein DedA with SNARE-associated domain